MRKIYLESIPRAQAKELLLENYKVEDSSAGSANFEVLPVDEALGRVTAAAVYAQTSLPNFPAAAMDGIAVKARETFDATERQPKALYAGKSYLPVDTGDPLPDDFDAVIKIEDIHEIDENTVEILAASAPGQHVRAVGEDVVAADMIVPAYHVLTPPDLGAILAGGHGKAAVLKKPRVAIIPTGDELVPPGSIAKKGEIVEFNGTVIAAYLREWGAEPVLHEIVRDKPELLERAVKEALQACDIVLINAGSSAGRDDYSVHVIKTLGKVLAHGVSTRPGKPVVLGMAAGKPVIGLPGYPVSAYLALDWFVRPLICKFLHQAEPQTPRLQVTLGRRVVSELGSEEFVRLTIGYLGGRFVANPLNRGAGVTMSLVRAHGLLKIPAESLGYEQGEQVEVELYRSEEELKNTLIATGSHDLALDLLASAIRRAESRFFLSSSNVGSMGGLMAIKNGEAHLAGVHLFDSKSGDYNVAYVQKYLGGEDIVLINFVYRMQGWIVEEGNPQHLESIDDLITKKAAFINRQKGAGTRLLFDYLLQQGGYVPAQIGGYNREEYSHLNVAAAVAAGSAQIGLGLLSAAKAFRLDFVPVAEERYDLLMRREFYESPAGQILRGVISDSAFQAEVEALGGYSMREAGRVIYDGRQ
jgi:putative molybdopterin biosynthesis protein